MLYNKARQATSKDEHEEKALLQELRAHSQGRDTLLAFQEALKKVCDHDSDAMHLVRAAQVAQRDV